MSEKDDGRRGSSQDPEGERHLTDEEIEAALAGFEEELNADDDGASRPDDGASANTAEQDHQASDPQTSGDASGEGIDFDDELEGLIGNKAKIATLITRLSSGELLAAFCRLAGIEADCIDTPEGAFAVLRALDGDEPETCARDLTSVVSGLSAVLAVNRADKLEATLWLNGHAGESFSPPVLFASTSSCVEDLLIGASNLSMVQVDGYSVSDTDELSDESAMAIIARHTRSGSGGHAAGTANE